MGEDPGAGDTRVTDEGDRAPEEIRRDIESTRDDLGDTVAALAEKTDVKARAQEKVAGVKETVSAKGVTIKETVSANAKAPENPLPVAVAGAFVAGVIVGRIMKR